MLDYLISKYGTTMTPSQIAKELHRHPTYVRVMCQSGQLPAVRIGGRWYVPTEAFYTLFEDAFVKGTQAAQRLEV